MKILIAGCSGLLGRSLYDYMISSNIDVIGTHNSNKYKHSVYLDFMNLSNLDNFFATYKPTVCINCVAQRFIDKCEDDWNNIYNINVIVTTNISLVCKKYNTYFIHISTDYIFDGTKNPYNIQSETNPLQNYGISKLIAEKRVIANCNKWCIIRVPVLYSQNIKNLSDTSVTAITKKILNRTKYNKEDDYCIRHPVYIPDFIPFIMKCIQYSIQGILHFYNPNISQTKFNIAKRISNILELSFNIIPDKSIDSKRPFDTNLSDMTITDEYKFTDFDQSLKECLNFLYYPKDLKDTFILLDLDGTLIDSDNIHYECYKEVLGESIIPNFNTFVNILHKEGIDKYLKIIGVNDIGKIKEEKYKLLLSKLKLDYIKGSKYLINLIHSNNINHAVVTNTSIQTVNYFKQLLPELNLLKNWVTRTDYNNPKPDGECYILAKNKYYKNEKYIIGVENTNQGIEALKSVTKTILVIDSEYIDHNEDCYFIKDLEHFSDFINN
jgi:S-adenosylmethionine synthetase